MIKQIDHAVELARSWPRPSEFGKLLHVMTFVLDLFFMCLLTMFYIYHDIYFYKRVASWELILKLQGGRNTKAGSVRCLLVFSDILPCLHVS